MEHDKDGKPLRMRGTTIDVTELRWAREELKEENRGTGHSSKYHRYSDLVSHRPEDIWTGKPISLRFSWKTT